MKHSFTVFIIIILSVLIFNSCRKAPEFSVIPQISFESIQKYRTTGLSPVDSILITISFKDGDGDLGLNGDNITPPFNPYTVVTDATGNIEKYGSKPGMPPYNANDQCNPYAIDTVYQDTAFVKDTVLITLNPHYYNYHIVFLKKVGTSYDTISTCPALNYSGRFPILSPANYSGALQGDLTITIYHDFIDLSQNLNNPEFYLLNQTVKFRIYIEDRALHQSNIIETTDITFTQ
jgi:hypothetical protein